jgi:hypothetical protein
MHGSSVLARAHSCPLASRMEFTHHEADSVLLPTPKTSAFADAVSSEEDFSVPLITFARLSAFLCLERGVLCDQLSAIRYEDPLD